MRLSKVVMKAYTDISEIISATTAEKVEHCSQVWTGDVGLELETGLQPQLAVSRGGVP